MPPRSIDESSKLGITSKGRLVKQHVSDNLDLSVLLAKWQTHALVFRLLKLYQVRHAALLHANRLSGADEDSTTIVDAADFAFTGTYLAANSHLYLILL